MELPKTEKKIKNSYDWIDIDGNIYSCKVQKNNQKKIIKKIQRVISGYKYCEINYIGKGCRTKRVHRIVAQTFIPNPNNLPYVGHKNNIKTDNRVENLYWTTPQENTKKTYDDGLVHNSKGFDDSQSKPVKMYETTTNKLLNEFGSIIIASKETGICKTTISRQCKYKRPVRKPFYFRYIDDTSEMVECQIIGEYLYDTDKLIDVFYNMTEASRITGIPHRTICTQCEKGEKPQRKTSEVYFLKIRE